MLLGTGIDKTAKEQGKKPNQKILICSIIKEMKYLTKTDQNMDFKTFKIKHSTGYYWMNSKIADNQNFYDYFPLEAKKLFVIEGFPELEFKNIIDSETDGLSIGYKGSIDIKDIFTLAPFVEVLFIQCESIVNAHLMTNFKKLLFLSFTTTKSSESSFVLPEQLNTFICNWNNKYKIDYLTPNSLEYISIENTTKFDFLKLLIASPKLIKIDFKKCLLNECFNEIIALKSLRYLSLHKCKILDVNFYDTINTSLKYLYLSKIEFNTILFILKFKKIEILIIEDCNEIVSLESLVELKKLKGLWLAGNTKIIDGDFFWLDKLVNLENLFIRDFKHYTHRSTLMWNWNLFGTNNKFKLYEKKLHR